MSPVTHFLTGWLVANVDSLERRDRALVTFASVIPDADGAGIITSITSLGYGMGSELYNQYHHVLAHNIFLSLFLFIVGYALAKKKFLTACLVLLSFHIHLLGDIFSGRGPDGEIWPIFYLFPVFKDLQFYWAGQWELNSWPNFVITITAIVFTLYLAWKRGFSPVSIFSLDADRAVVNTLQNRFSARL